MDITKTQEADSEMWLPKYIHTQVLQTLMKKQTTIEMKNRHMTGRRRGLSAVCVRQRD